MRSLRSWSRAPSGYRERWQATLRTPEVYDRLLRRFNGWCIANERVLISAADVDEAGANCCALLNKAQAAQFLAALLRAFPPLRGQLHWTHAEVRAKSLQAPPQHHPPMSWEIALALAFGLRRCGYFRDSALLVFQWRFGLRPTEAMYAVAADITLPRRPGEVGIVRLGVKFGTKVRRTQFVRAYPQDAVTIFLLKRLLVCRRPDERIGAATSTPQFTARLRRAAAAVGLPPIWTGHCARAGWTTARHLAGQPFSDLREDGRWACDSSLRVYIDAVTTIDIAGLTAVRERALWLSSLEQSFWNDFLWL